MSGIFIRNNLKHETWTCVLRSYGFEILYMAAPVAERLRALFPVSLSLDQLTAVSRVGSSPALATCETSQVLLAGVSGGFSRGSPVFDPPSD